jgi:hypothetical protein
LQEKKKKGPLQSTPSRLSSFISHNFLDYDMLMYKIKINIILNKKIFLKALTTIISKPPSLLSFSLYNFHPKKTQYCTCMDETILSRSSSFFKKDV